MNKNELQYHYFIIIILLKLLICAYSKLSSLFLKHEIYALDSQTLYSLI